MKCLVLGCNGMAGHMVSLYFKEKGNEVVGFSRNKSKYVNSICGDVQNTRLLSDVIKTENFDVVINCVGILNKNAEDNRAEAVFINSYLPHFLVEVTSSLKTKIIHMSTDCVFSGKKGRYTEYDFKDGETFYDRTKALGEIVDNKNLTLRNSIIGPDIKKEGIGLMNWFLQQSGQVYGFIKAIWTGQTTLQLAKTMEYAINNDVTGIINAVPKESITKYDLLKLFDKYLKNKEREIIPTDMVNLDKSLIKTRDDFNYEIPDYEQMIYDLSKWMKAHKEMYPHYDL